MKLVTLADANTTAEKMDHGAYCVSIVFLSKSKSSEAIVRRSIDCPFGTKFPPKNIPPLLI
jgi:hypothetical protein